MLAAGTGKSHAQLPALNEPPWLGFFIGHKGTRGMFGITANGELYYHYDSGRETVNSGYYHRILPSVQETLSNGEISRHSLVPETLQTTDQPNKNPGTVTFQGKVKNGAKIEVVVEITRRDISIGGRIVEPAPGGNPQRFILYTEAPPFYLGYGEERIRREGSAEQKAELERRNAPQIARAAKENLTFRRLDGSRHRQPILDEVDLSSAEFNREGFSEIELDLHVLQARKMTISTTANSRMMFSNEGTLPIFKQRYRITWMEDPATTQPGRGRMVFTTR